MSEDPNKELRENMKEFVMETAEERNLRVEKMVLKDVAPGLVVGNVALKKKKPKPSKKFFFFSSN